MMNMHRAGDAPDWDRTPRDKRNFWQRIAAQTNGYGTPGNVLSIGGFAMVVVGLWIVDTHSIWEGTLFVAFGRLADILDGITAHHTGTKSPLGRGIDAALDKIGALAALAVFGANNIMPLWIAAAILIQNIFTITVGVYAPWRRVALSPSREGKLATAGFWVTIVLFVAARLLSESHLANWQQPVYAIAYVFGISSLALGTYAAVGYMATVLSVPPRREQ
jgi:phosphatidylglycerophosphate synthase